MITRHALAGVLLASIILASGELPPVSVSAPAPAEAAFEPLTWNADVKDNGNGTKTADILGGWVNYMDAGNQWKAIDTTLAQTATGFVMNKAPFAFRAPLLANGQATFYSNNRYDIFTKRNIEDAPMEMKMQADAQPVAGQIYDMSHAGSQDAVLYPNAYPQWNADLIYYVKHGRAPELQKLIRYNAIPAPCSDPQATLQASFGIELGETPDIYKEGSQTKWKTQTMRTQKKLAFRRSGSDVRGIGMREFRVWDSRIPTPRVPRKEQLINVDIAVNGNGYTLTKNTPCSFFTGAVIPVFADTTSTFYPDSTVSTSFDGAAGKEGPDDSTYATIRDGNGTFARINQASDGACSFLQAGSASNTWFMIADGFFLFDISIIGALQTVTDATFSLVVNSKAAGLTDSYGIVAATTASNTTLATTDYEGTVSNTTRFATDKASGSITADGATYNDWVFNATGVAAVDAAKTGVVKIGLKNASNIDNTAPSWAAGNPVASLTCAMADAGSTSTDPKLSVTYSAAATTTARSVIFY